MQAERFTCWLCLVYRYKDCYAKVNYCYTSYDCIVVIATQFYKSKLYPAPPNVLSDGEARLGTCIFT